jgi:hypothetical protein
MERKDPAQFYANKGWADGRHPYCKTCLLAYQRERRRQRLDLAEPTRRRWTQEFVRHEYFSELRVPVSAYVAGLLAADGNVLARQRRVSLELCTRDEQLVHLTRDEIAPGFPVRRRVRPNGTESTILAVTSAQMCADLGRLGITPRKSLTLEWPEMKHELLRHFLLGYFDGDGFITRSRNGAYVYLRWALLGTYGFLSAAMQFIARETGVTLRSARRHGERSVHKLAINGADALVVDEWLHRGTELGLSRKRFDPAGGQADSAASSSLLR